MENINGNNFHFNQKNIFSSFLNQSNKNFLDLNE
jgi:hypothetical protein